MRPTYHVSHRIVGQMERSCTTDLIRLVLDNKDYRKKINDSCKCKKIRKNLNDNKSKSLYKETKVGI